MRAIVCLLLTLSVMSITNASNGETPQFPEDVTIKDIIKLAEEGDKHAQHLIGSSFLFGEEVLGEKYTNQKQALIWLDNAIRKNPINGFFIGKRLVRRDKPVLAQQYYQKAVNAGHKDALIELAYLYLGENHSELGNFVAKRYLEAAASYGNSYAYVQMGRMHQYGWGITQDFGKAEQYFQTAIKHGDTKGYSALALMKEKDLPSPDYREILDLFLKDAPYGHPSAIMGINRLYAKHQTETGLTQTDVLFWEFVQKFHMVARLGFPKKILQEHTKYHDGLTEKQISKIKKKAEALAKSFSESN